MNEERTKDCLCLLIKGETRGRGIQTKHAFLSKQALLVIGNLVIGNL